MSDIDTTKRAYVIKTATRYYGRGVSLSEAVRNVKAAGACNKDVCGLLLVVGDEKPVINEMGGVEVLRGAVCEMVCRDVTVSKLAGLVK